MKRRVMAVLVAASGVVLLTAPTVAGGAATRRSPNIALPAEAVTRTATVENTKVVARLSFNGPRDVRFIRIKVADGGRLVADTRDCCLEGDHWLVTLIDRSSGSAVGAADRTASACGNGHVDRYTGSASMRVREGTVTALVAYCSGVGIFGAGMSVRFRYDGRMSVRA
jgi:hypothetical protein